MEFAKVQKIRPTNIEPTTQSLQVIKYLLLKWVGLLVNAYTQKRKMIKIRMYTKKEPEGN